MVQSPTFRRTILLYSWQSRGTRSADACPIVGGVSRLSVYIDDCLLAVVVCCVVLRPMLPGHTAIPGQSAPPEVATPPGVWRCEPISLEWRVTRLDVLY